MIQHLRNQLFILRSISSQGTVGLIINRPMQFPLGLVFDQLQIEPIPRGK